MYKRQVPRLAHPVAACLVVGVIVGVFSVASNVPQEIIRDARGSFNALSSIFAWGFWMTIRVRKLSLISHDLAVLWWDEPILREHKLLGHEDTMSLPPTD